MLADRGFLAALPLGEGLVSFCVTEKHDRIECEELVNAVKSAFDALGGARE